MSKIIEGINSLVEGSYLSGNQTREIMEEIMSGRAENTQIGAFLTALRIKGETPDIVSAAAEIMRKYSNQITIEKSKFFVDTCGTGGDKSNTFNISTLSAIVAAGAGITIAKHGNRSVSSKCGSADILEAFGANINLEPKKVEEIINEVGFGFMFAPKFHPAMKYAMPARKSLAMRTIFNILGPLTNPASAQNHVLGVFDKNLTEDIALSMNKLGVNHVYVVNSDPGIDEIVPLTKVYISEVNNGSVQNYTLTREDFGLEKFSLKDIQAGELEKNLTIARDILLNEDNGIKRQIVVINAAYAILSANIVDDVKEAIAIAEESLNSGKALKILKRYVLKTGGDIEKFEHIFSL